MGAANTGSLIPCHACILGGVKKIPYFKPAVLSKARFHVFVGQETALARITFFATCPSTVSGHSNPIGSVDLEGKVSYQYLEELPSETGIHHLVLIIESICLVFPVNIAVFDFFVVWNCFSEIPASADVVIFSCLI